MSFCRNLLIKFCVILELFFAMKKALITWITGQDWAYLAELLLSKWYEVYGIKRRTSSFNTSRIDHLYQDPHVSGRRFILLDGDMTDSANIIKTVATVMPDEIYNLAAQSHVHVSFNIPEYTANADGIGVLRLLEAIKLLWLAKTCKFYQAATSEMFGGVGYNMPPTWYTEESHFHPRSPYGAAKLYGYRITRNYRESYDMFACNGILFNHESPLRGETFVTRKITRAVAKIHLWLEKTIYLWNLDAQRDRWHAKDYVEAMRLMLQHDTPADYVIATGKTQSVRTCVEAAFSHVGISLEWRGTGVDEKWYNTATGEVLVEIDPRYFRPAEVDVLLWDATKAKKELWRSPKYTFEELIAEMVAHDIDIFKKEVLLKDNWYTTLHQHE